MIVRNTKQTAKGLSTYLIKRVFSPFHYRLKQLEKSQWWTLQQHQENQLRLLQDVVNHAYRTVPYYRNLMDTAHLTPADIQSLEDIQRFPVMTKATIREAGRQLYSTKYPSLLTRTAFTGGTTGVRLPLKRDVWSIGNEHAFVQRFFRWAGIRAKDRCALLIARRICPQDRQESQPYAYDAVMKELTMSVFHLSTSNASIFIDALRRYRIKALIGYPSAISTLARYSLMEGDPIRLNVVLTTSETLESSRKEIISEAFGCPVFDFYGSGERVCYIQMCPHDRYHVISEYGITEFADIPGQTDVKKIIATGFWNRAMPLIRYDTGDQVQLEDAACSCGRAYPCVKRIVGRQGQLIQTPSGREIGPTVLEAIMENILFDMKSIPVAEAQMALEGPANLVLEYVPMPSFSSEDERAVAALAQKHFPVDFQVTVRSVEKIQRTVSGKALSLVLRDSPAGDTIHEDQRNA